MQMINKRTLSQYYKIVLKYTRVAQDRGWGWGLQGGKDSLYKSLNETNVDHFKL